MPGHDCCGEEHEEGRESNKDGQAGNIGNEYRYEIQGISSFIRLPYRDDEANDGQENKELPDLGIGVDRPAHVHKNIEEHCFGSNADRGPDPQKETRDR